MMAGFRLVRSQPRQAAAPTDDRNVGAVASRRVAVVVAVVMIAGSPAAHAGQRP